MSIPASTELTESLYISCRKKLSHTISAPPLRRQGAPEYAPCIYSPPLHAYRQAEKFLSYNWPLSLIVKGVRKCLRRVRVIVFEIFYAKESTENLFSSALFPSVAYIIRMSNYFVRFFKNSLVWVYANCFTLHVSLRLCSEWRYFSRLSKALHSHGSASAEPPNDCGSCFCCRLLHTYCIAVVIYTTATFVVNIL